MAEEGNGISLVILGIVAIVAIIGLVLLFGGKGTAGAATIGCVTDCEGPPKGICGVCSTHPINIDAPTHISSCFPGFGTRLVTAVGC